MAHERHDDWRAAIGRSDVLNRLRGFDPRIVGTLPIGLALPTSDIDIVCHAPDATLFASTLWMHFGGESGFAIHQWRSGLRPVVARFVADGWPFEIFGAGQPVADQPGWRHFEVERRLLDLGGTAFRATVMRLREAGAKTEPAFAQALDLSGDPYAAMFDLFDATDEALRALLDRV